MSLIQLVATFVGGLVVGFGAASYGATALLSAAARQGREWSDAASRWRKLAEELGAHLEHTKRMLSHARKTRSAVKILGLGERASQDDVRRTFKALARVAHPDHGGNAEVFSLVVRAKDAAMREAEP